ncbi:MAG: 4'-phosphopantetheinyl transferase superfamily protein [Gammaproteobacteria bacterium]|nr:4'-phosphopantetheinyl transferase superfamily protein [Gammaproteobacteria bacterium]
MSGTPPNAQIITVLDALFPSGATTAMLAAGGVVTAPAPEELAFTKGFQGKRLAEFGLGRASARCALQRLGQPAVGIPVGRNREPLWPPGIVGSITHADNCAAAVVGLKPTFTALGLDLEPAEPLEASLWERISRPAELQRLGGALVTPGLGVRLIFSAKESVYKALWPLTKQFLDFHDLQTWFDAESGCFSVTFSGKTGDADEFTGLEGRFLLADGLIATGVSLRNHS